MNLTEDTKALENRIHRKSTVISWLRQTQVARTDAHSRDLLLSLMEQRPLNLTQENQAFINRFILFVSQKELKGIMNVN